MTHCSNVSTLPIGEDPPAEVAEDNQHSLDDPKLGERVERLERIVEEFLVVEDSRQPGALQEVVTQDAMPQFPHLVATS